MGFLSSFGGQPAKIKNGVYFSPGDECLQAILQFIRSAQNSLQVCVFTISDDRITQALIDAFRQGLEIKLLTDNEKLFDKGADIRELAKEGLEIRVDNTPNHMHHKFAVADHSHVLTGSYNWTRSAALYNHENVLVTNDKFIAAAYSRHFEELWAEMVPFR
ncbi:phospholipase D-like domain-containing protein [Rufibacter sp. LB8]|uniref:phospholipase D-like domain-containing protein n=1 Tax=Rufibacter sp. LB8 TaxID=2777781 RepID=UPI00178C36CC|nr:phospholipase D-like domain-containing protein [Rufibacter sp. LB8]